MKTYNIATILASAVVALVLSMGCGADGSPSSVTTGSGGSGGGTTSTSSTSSAGGMGGQGGMPNACSSDIECVWLNDPLLRCWLSTCLNGMCDRVPSPLGTPCNDHDPGQVCDGLGKCREVFEYAGACYVRPDSGFPEPCPTCDDGDPCTVDACINDACVHNAMPEGHACGPWFTCQAGNCCPHPDTLP